MAVPDDIDLPPARTWTGVDDHLVGSHRPMTPHGTVTGYQYWACRCDPCRDANRTYKRNLRETKGQIRSNNHHWPLQPLFEAAGTDDFTELGYLTGFAARTIHRWETNGIPDLSADQAACALGLHPSTIWPNWFDPYLQGAA